MRKILLISVLALLLNSCNNDVEIVNPVSGSPDFISETTPLNINSKNYMEGIYSVLQGQELLGEQVVVKWTRDRLSIFSGNNGGFINLEGGSLDSVLFFQGFWRQILNTETGVVNFYIPSEEGGKSILDCDTSAREIRLKGSYGYGNELAGKKIILFYQRPFSQIADNRDFQILAHRGGGRNSDYLGVSENSIPMINIAERLGATGIEIDLRLSRDGVPFIYHDNDINLRLCQKSLIWGNIEDFTWPQIRTLITLRNGEKIPSLQEVLEFVLEHTTLRTVWFDIKDAKVLSKAVEVQNEILQRAASSGRDLKIYIGIPNEEIFNAFSDYPGHLEIPSLCELSPEDVRSINADVWAPRWTLGLQSSEVMQVHAEGRKAFVWTLDEPNYIEQYLREGQFDGILTNYPEILAYYHYIR
jgi:glycerophosphoryl diester phosphodiesterase